MFMLVAYLVNIVASQQAPLYWKTPATIIKEAEKMRLKCYQWSPLNHLHSSPVRFIPTILQSEDSFLWSGRQVKISNFTTPCEILTNTFADFSIDLCDQCFINGWRRTTLAIQLFNFSKRIDFSNFQNLVWRGTEFRFQWFENGCGWVVKVRLKKRIFWDH